MSFLVVKDKSSSGSSSAFRCNNKQSSIGCLTASEYSCHSNNNDNKGRDRKKCPQSLERTGAWKRGHLTVSQSHWSAPGAESRQWDRGRRKKHTNLYALVPFPPLANLKQKLVGTGARGSAPQKDQCLSSTPGHRAGQEGKECLMGGSRYKKNVK